MLSPERQRSLDRLKTVISCVVGWYISLVGLIWGQEFATQLMIDLADDEGLIEEELQEVE